MRVVVDPGGVENVSPPAMPSHVFINLKVYVYNLLVVYRLDHKTFL